MQFDPVAHIKSSSFDLDTVTVAPTLPSCAGFPDSIRMIKFGNKYALRFENTYKCDQNDLPPIESILLITQNETETSDEQYCSFNAKNDNDYYLQTRGDCDNYVEGDYVTIRILGYSSANGYTTF